MSFICCNKYYDFLIIIQEDIVKKTLEFIELICGASFFEGRKEILYLFYLLNFF